jgi:hypothetical protein
MPAAAVMASACRFSGAFMRFAGKEEEGMSFRKIHPG